MSLFIDLAAAEEAVSSLRTAGRDGSAGPGLGARLRDTMTSFLLPGNVAEAHRAVAACRRSFGGNVGAMADGIERAAQVTRLADMLES